MVFTYQLTDVENHFIVDTITKDDGTVIYGGLFITGFRGEEQLQEMVEQFIIDCPFGVALMTS